jgi:hypothetical protein
VIAFPRYTKNASVLTVTYSTGISPSVEKNISLIVSHQQGNEADIALQQKLLQKLSPHRFR